MNLDHVQVSAMAHVNVAAVEACLNEARDRVLRSFAGRKLACGSGDVRH
jgi:hypothetical protein